MADIEKLMNNLNEVQKAIRINNLKSEFDKSFTLEVINQAIQTVEELQIQIPKWHLCKDELPSDSDYYMARIYNSDCDMYDYRKTWFAHEKDYDGESEWRELYSYESVIAWTELPKFESEEE